MPASLNYLKSVSFFFSKSLCNSHISFDFKPLIEFVNKASWFGIFFVKKLKKFLKKYMYF